MDMLEVQGDRFMQEGFLSGDLLEIGEPEEPLSGKIVVAQLIANESLMIRRYQPDGEMIHFLPCEGDSDAIIVSKEDEKFSTS